jgi:hypothetical protein
MAKRNDSVSMDDVCRDPSVLDSLTLGEMLALSGLEIEVDGDGLSDAEKTAATKALANYKPAAHDA